VRGLGGGHAVRELRVDPETDRLAHVVVDVALRVQIERVLVVGAEAQVPKRRLDRVEIGEQGDRVVGQ
jgi:hypothetical protein